MLRRTVDDVGAPEYPRDLRQSPASPLEIQFTTTLQFPSEEDDWDAGQMVDSGFQSPAQQKNYIEALQETYGGSYFGGLESMSMGASDDLNQEGQTSLRPDETLPGMGGSFNGAEESFDAMSDDDVSGIGGENKVYFIVATVVGSTCIILFATAIVIYVVTRKKRRTEKNEKVQSHPTASTSQHYILPIDEIELEVETKCETLNHQQTPTSYIGTIKSKEDEDDVSTLGDPYMGDAVNAVMDTDHTVGESMVSSQQELYVYGVGRQTATDATLVGGSTINSGSHVRNMIFGDDPTLEGIYTPPLGTSSTMMGDDPSDQFQSVTVVAPSGKLGIVLDNPHGDLPIVWATKETSSLHGRVQVGDLLMSVDGVDCRGMSTQRVSSFLSSRSQNPVRTLVLARGSGMGTDMVGV
mmetsp:Transcript_37009/g.68553  ORF Transcript_37009/g.68553 Transcript_37009/m.68553 type:complete len:410 (-) Transcript_37009:367-1596(-)